ncbi:hypothetical protein CYLTODRAFT_137712 [Cylindrobasidium torrendii FP15055 ss-10]|uniref:Uncharacterized protein n=1 Tax=Cylindrobasidium torrendii FP15055 ss-10 TaxID=1314674 RepID=A0A0D7B1M0_9AGAR|nr:hypothetical protein CYLTODRAFT_137712 [Cylindrobasidium torrendii FP15055 ss-10]
MSEKQFYDVNGIRVRRHVVRSPHDFPVEIQSITQGLQCPENNVGADLVAGSSLDRALKAANSCLERVRRMNVNRRSLYANVELEPTTNAVGLTPGYILEQCIPESQIHFQCEYSRAMCPYQDGNTSSHTLSPYGAAISALTLPLSLATVDIVSASDDNVPKVHDPFLQGHFLRTQYGHDEIPFPVLFVALADEIYELLASAVLHRRTLGVHSPCLAFVHDPLNCHLRAVWAWSPSHGDLPCLEVRVAHAPWSTSPSQELGVFDVQDKVSVTALAVYLYRISMELHTDALTAQKNAPDTCRSLSSTPATYWRVDQNQFFHGRPELTGHAEEVNQWLRSLTASDASSSSSIEEEYMSTDSPSETDDDNKLAEARSALLKAKWGLKRWMLSHRDIAFADFSHWLASGTSDSDVESLIPEIALFCGTRTSKCAFPTPEFPDDEDTTEPVKMGLEYIRCSLPPGGNLPSVDFSQINAPTLPNEIVFDEGDLEIPCTLETPGDIEAFLYFRAAAQTMRWSRISWTTCRSS